MKFPRLPQSQTKQLKQDLMDKDGVISSLHAGLEERDQTITRLTGELQSKTALIENLARAYATHDLAGMFDGLRRTLCEQIDKTRDHGAQQYWDLMERLERGRDQIHKLQTFISIAMRHIGRMEGQAKLTHQIVLTSEESRDVIQAAEIYQRTLQP